MLNGIAASSRKKNWIMHVCRPALVASTHLSIRLFIYVPVDCPNRSQLPSVMAPIAQLFLQFTLRSLCSHVLHMPPWHRLVELCHQRHHNSKFSAAETANNAPIHGYENRLRCELATSAGLHTCTIQLPLKAARPEAFRPRFCSNYFWLHQHRAVHC